MALALESFYRDLEVTDHVAGRRAIAPEILVGLWLLATLDGIGSAGELARRCETDIPYLWMRGTVRVNYHTLSDFRVQHGQRLDEYVKLRARRAEPEYQTLYKSRPSIAEFPNADCRNRNLRQFRVRGLVQVKAVALWHALAFNLLRLMCLQAQAI